MDTKRTNKPSECFENFRLDFVGVSGPIAFAVMDKSGGLNGNYY